MNKQRRFLVTSLSLLLVGTLFGCVNNNQDAPLTAKGNVTITFNAIEGTGKWLSTGTSIRTLTLLKGYTWQYLKDNLKDKEAIINGKDIDVIYDETRRFVANEHWLLTNGQPIPNDYVINEDLILNANYEAQYIAAKFIASDEALEPDTPHHTIGGYRIKDVTKPDRLIQVGDTWGKIKGDYTPTCEEGFLNEPFLYYQNADGDKVTDEYIIKNNDVLTAVYQINHPVNFMTDSWTTISEAANLGFTYMHNNSHNQGGYYEEYHATVFYYHDDPYTKGKDTFVGLRHEVLIGKKTYDAVVIGENIDKASNNTNATLTFQIEQIVNMNKSYDTIEHNLNRFSESALREYLNNNFIYTLSPDLQNAIVPVNKLTNWGGREGSQGDVRETIEQIFPFSLAELDILTTSGGASEKEGFGNTHLAPYPYYNDATDNDRIRHALNQEDASAYWVRSPDPDVANFAWSIDTTGKVVNRSTDIVKSLGVVCGFCVGAKR